ncbi:hypothetical protein D3C80_1546230 [compost metagenome]
MLASDEAAAEHAQARHRIVHVAGTVGRPQQGWITGETALLQHLYAACAVDPDDAVIVFGHVLDQHGQQLVDHALAFALAFVNGQRGQVAQ